jgi:peptidyl-prolyl cis-trans isomerase C
MRIETKRSSAPKIVAVNEAVIASADIAREVQNHKGGSPVAA